MVNSCFHKPSSSTLMINSSLILTIVKWIPLMLVWMKLNTYGFSQGNLDMARGGGVIGGHVGHCIYDFSRHIGIATSVIAELWAIRDDFALGPLLGLTSFVVELDALFVVSLISNEFNAHIGLSSIVDDYRLLV